MIDCVQKKYVSTFLIISYAEYKTEKTFGLLKLRKIGAQSLPRFGLPKYLRVFQIKTSYELRDNDFILGFFGD